MCEEICVYIYTYIHTCIHTCVHEYIHTCIHTYMHTYIHTHTYTHTYIIHIFICIHISTYLHIVAHIHICMIVLWGASQRFFPEGAYRPAYHGMGWFMGTVAGVSLALAGSKCYPVAVKGLKLSYHNRDTWYMVGFLKNIEI